jgi:hypothetical protein
MNKLFRVLFVGAYIPYAVLLSYYFTRFYIAYFIILSLYLSSCFAVLTHKPYLEKGVLAWVRAKRVCELLLISSFSVRAYYRSQLMTLAGIAVGTILVCKIPRRYQSKCEHPAVYVTACMLYITNADILGKMCTLMLSVLIMYEQQARKINDASFEWAIERRLRQYHTVKLLQIYLLFFMEYSITKMNMWALLIIIASVFLYSGYACLTLPMDVEVKVSEFYMKVYELPDRYPLPLDIKDAITNCEVARRVFKTHEI